MNEAIKLAIEKGGYIPFSDELACWEDHTALDPLFWQALGKALGWDEGKFYGYTIRFIPKYVHFALQYHEINLTGGDINKFWKELINKNDE